MKKLFSIVCISLFMFSSTTFAQKKNDCCEDCCSKKAAKAVVTKGYYSIGKHAQKLANTTYCTNDKDLAAQVSRNAPAPSKGFYSIGRNQEKLPAPGTMNVSGDSKPVAEKGYYAIGNKKQQLGTSGVYNSFCGYCECHDRVNTDDNEASSFIE